MMITITGVHIEGDGYASGNLEKQILLIKEEFPEIGECYPASINLLLDEALIVAAPDHQTKPIKWDENPPEVFDFLRISLEAPKGTKPINAWIYIPHRSDHRKNLRVHEIIAPKREIKCGQECKIKIDRQCKKLPYSQYPLVVVL